MTRPNAKIRREARAAEVPFWKIARYLGISEPTMTRRMREELDPAAQEQILQVIRLLSDETDKHAEPDQTDNHVEPDQPDQPDQPGQTDKHADTSQPAETDQTDKSILPGEPEKGGNAHAQNA